MEAVPVGVTKPQRATLEPGGPASRFALNDRVRAEVRHLDQFVARLIDAAKGAGVEKVGIITEGMRRAAARPTGGN